MSLAKVVFFYGRFLIPFSRIGFRLKGLSVPDSYAGLTGKTVLVTGATGGIGEGLALGAARSGATVLAVGRSEDKLAALAGKAAGMAGRIEPIRADVDLVAGTRALLRDLTARQGGIDVLFNNIGILHDDFQATPEGLDAMYAVNILNPYILTQGLIEAGKLDGGVIVNMASGGMYGAAQNLRFMEQTSGRFNGTMAYGTHKRAQMVLSDWWGREGTGITAYTMHPGWVDTEGVQRSLPQFRRVLRRVLRNAEQGADTGLWLAGTRPGMKPGALWFDRAPRTAHAYSYTRAEKASAEEIRTKLAADAARLSAEFPAGDAA